MLEQAGFVLESRLRHSVIEQGELQDQLLYANVPVAEGGTAPGA